MSRFKPTEEEMALLQALKPVDSVETLGVLLEGLKSIEAAALTEVMVPEASLEETRTEIKDVYLLVERHKAGLEEVGYDEAQRKHLRDAIVAFLSVEEVFEGRLRTGSFRAMTVEEVVAVSKPWREKLRVKANQAFYFNPARKASYQDHNETGTVDEEISDLRMLLSLAAEDREALAKVGFKEEDIKQGEGLLQMAEGRNAVAILGVRTQSDTRHLRDRMLTLTTALCRYARASGLSAFHDDPQRAAEFERVSFKNALRRVRRGKRSAPPA